MKSQKNNKKIEFEEYEKALQDMGFSCVCGVDEVGRGPWAGPITACAVISNSEFLISKIREDIRDSKQLSGEKREKIFAELIKNKDIIYNIASVGAEEIDQIGLGNANYLVIKKAIEGLPQIPDYILVDGFIVKGLNMRHERVIKGDQKVLSIAAASIIAKVHRDHYMIELSKKYPGYGFEDHKGYGTEKHIKALKEFGVCPEHRRSFKPIREIANSK